MLYAHGTDEVTLDDVMTVVSDASELTLDPIVDGVFAGMADGRERIRKAMVAGTTPASSSWPRSAMPPGCTSRRSRSPTARRLDRA